MLTKKEANKLRGLVSRHARCQWNLAATLADTGEQRRQRIVDDAEKAASAVWAAIRAHTIHDVQTESFYVLMVDGMYIQKYGLASGPGTWLSARRFMKLGDACAAQAEPGWHNDPAAVRRARPVKVRVRIDHEIARA